jgi:hypothetical protein
MMHFSKARVRAGFNCAEAVNFGPPDWLPWGTYVANKYRREGRSATLSHDALLVALVTAAPEVAQRLPSESEVRAFPHWKTIWLFLWLPDDTVPPAGFSCDRGISCDRGSVPLLGACA